MFETSCQRQISHSLSLSLSLSPSLSLFWNSIRNLRVKEWNIQEYTENIWTQKDRNVHEARSSMGTEKKSEHLKHTKWYSFTLLSPFLSNSNQCVLHTLAIPTAQRWHCNRLTCLQLPLQPAKWSASPKMRWRKSCRRPYSVQLSHSIDPINNNNEDNNIIIINNIDINKKYTCVLSFSLSLSLSLSLFIINLCLVYPMSNTVSPLMYTTKCWEAMWPMRAVMSWSSTRLYRDTHTHTQLYVIYNQSVKVSTINQQ